MSTNRQASRCAFLLGTLLVAACTRTCQQEEPLPGQRHAVPSPVPDAGAPGSAVTEAKPGVRPTVARVSPVDGGAASSAWPSDLPTRWFEVWKDEKGPFVPVDCVGIPLKRMAFRDVPGGQQLTFRTPWDGEDFSLREVVRTADGLELRLAPSNREAPTMRLLYHQGEVGRWLRDGSPLDLHPMEEIDRWRVRQVCIGSPFLEGKTEQEYVDEQLANVTAKTQEFQGRPPTPKLDVVRWGEELLQGLPRDWVELGRQEEQVIQVGCDGVLQSSRLELRAEDGLLVLDQPYLIYAVTRLQRSSAGVRLALVNTLRGTVEQEVEIHYTPGAAEATWSWKILAEADVETRRVLPLATARALPSRRTCE